MKKSLTTTEKLLIYLLCCKNRINLGQGQQGCNFRLCWKNRLRIEHLSKCSLVKQQLQKVKPRTLLAPRYCRSQHHRLSRPPARILYPHPGPLPKEREQEKTRESGSLLPREKGYRASSQGHNGGSSLLGRDLQVAR